jgi:UDP-N-acetylglucosamine 2-epimerase (non-hydrolysing)
MTSFEVGVVVGTRPEIIKMAPVIRELRSSDGFETYLVHTNQHYDEALSAVFFDNLDLPAPDENVQVKSDSHGRQTAQALVGVESVIQERTLDAILAQGDTNAVLSTAIAASKTPIPFGHVEAGIRSYDRTMPEEINRVIADHVSDMLFAPTETAAANLAAEGIESGVTVTGNTVVDACLEHVPIADEHSTILDELGLDPKEYVVATIHRPRNTDEPERLRRIVEALDRVAYPVVLPAHPRTQAAIDELGFEPEHNLVLTHPLDYLDFLKLENHARLIVTDSGGLQEEASILEVPCLTVRPNTERPETVAAGVNRLVEPEEIEQSIADVCDDSAEQMTGAPSLYGDGDSGGRIVQYLSEALRSDD